MAVKAFKAIGHIYVQVVIGIIAGLALGVHAVLQGKVPFVDEEIAAPTYVTSQPLPDSSASVQA